MTDTTTLSVALDYAAQGRPVFPCHTPTGPGCSCCRPDCSSPGKHPRTRRGLHDASTDPRTVINWWNRWPDANVGVVTGRPSGLVVVDVDPDHGGIDSMRALVSEHGRLPDGPRVRTGSGGWHVLFEAPDQPLRNSAGRLGAGVDVRADGGYVIAPPSRHVAGGQYRWIRGGTPPELPDWLTRLIDPPAPEPAQRSREPIHLPNALDRWAQAAVRGEIDRVRYAPVGSRNHALNRAAFALGQIAGTGALDADAIASHLHHAATSAGLGEYEATRTIRSGLNAGLGRPRGPASEPASSNRPVEADVGLDVDPT